MEENLVSELALHTYNPNTQEAKARGFQATLSYIPVSKEQKLKITKIKQNRLDCSYQPSPAKGEKPWSSSQQALDLLVTTLKSIHPTQGQHSSSLEPIFN